MNIFEQDVPGEKYVFLDWDEVLSVESDEDGVTVRLHASHPLIASFGFVHNNEPLTEDHE